MFLFVIILCLAKIIFRDWGLSLNIHVTTVGTSFHAGSCDGSLNNNFSIMKVAQQRVIYCLVRDIFSYALWLKRATT